MRLELDAREDDLAGEWLAARELEEGFAGAEDESDAEADVEPGTAKSGRALKVDADPTDLYLAEIGRHQLLTAEEEPLVRGSDRGTKFSHLARLKDRPIAGCEGVSRP